MAQKDREGLIDQEKAWQLFEAAFSGDIAKINELTKDSIIYYFFIVIFFLWAN